MSSTETESVAQVASDPVVSLHPTRWAVFLLWLIAGIGPVGAVIGAVTARGWSAVGLVAFGCAWAGLFVALTRPFVEVRAEGLAYRRYVRQVLVPWRSVDRVLVTAPGVAPRLLILRRDPRALVSVELTAGGPFPSDRRDRIELVLRAAALFTRSESSHLDAPLPAGRSVRMRGGTRAKTGEVVLVGAIAVGLVLLVAGPRAWRGGLVSPLLVWTLMLIDPFGNVRSAVGAVEVDTSGLQVTAGGLRRRTTHYRPDSIDRILAVPRRHGADLAIVFRDHSMITVPARSKGHGTVESVEDTAARMEAVLQHARSPRFSPR